MTRAKTREHSTQLLNAVSLKGVRGKEDQEDYCLIDATLDDRNDESGVFFVPTAKACSLLPPRLRPVASGFATIETRSVALVESSRRWGA